MGWGTGPREGRCLALHADPAAVVGGESVNQWWVSTQLRRACFGSQMGFRPAGLRQGTLREKEQRWELRVCPGDYKSEVPGDYTGQGTGTVGNDSECGLTQVNWSRKLVVVWDRRQEDPDSCWSGKQQVWDYDGGDGKRPRKGNPSLGKGWGWAPWGDYTSSKSPFSL